MDHSSNNRRRLLKSVIAIGASVPFIGNAIPTSAAFADIKAKRQAAVDALRHKVSSSEVQFPPSYNPMAGNPLKTRSDAVNALRDLYLPLTPYYSRGGARVRLDMAGARQSREASDLEGFARPLWGLAALGAGGGDQFVDWDLIRRGLANGTNPSHREYWGDTGDRSQHLVEIASIGFSLAMIPHILFSPQPAESKKHIASYLQTAFKREEVDTNWLFFRLMMGLGLKAIGEPVDQQLIHEYEKKIDAHYVADGWYRDGATRRMDYYIPFAFHFYGLLNAKLGGDPVRTTLYKERATVFVNDFVRWFADDGAALAYGRSLAYRFACGGFWAALAFADTPVLPWGQIKGLVLRHLRWWSKQPMAHRDGVLSIGYSYPNLQMSEPYNSGGSPYWAFKMFAFLALPETHPFWMAKEEALPHFSDVSTQTQPGMLLMQLPGDVIALASGQEEAGDWCRMAAEKYCKFAYSARYGFGVEVDWNHFPNGSFDNALAFSSDGVHFTMRERNQLVKIAPNLLYAQWSPNDGVNVETWLLTAAPWHIRIHRIVANKAHRIVEGGFCMEDAATAVKRTEQTGFGLAISPTDVSGIRDVGSTITRQGRVYGTPPNSNLIHSKAIVPQLLGEIPAGETVLVTAVLAMGASVDASVAWQATPKIPAIAELEAIIRLHGVLVGATKVKV